MNISIIATIIVAIIILIYFSGLYLSVYIVETTDYVFFWIMYILSAVTLLNIFGGIYFYSVMKNKTGPRGPRGIKGEVGDTGKTGRCTVECRNNMCQISTLQHIIDTLNSLEKSYGDAGDLQVDTDLRNPYIKEKVKAICNSDEYQQMAPIKGPEVLTDYIKSIWTDITTRLYNSGGLNYFRTIGAEYDWDWLDENPWDEFKKYDIYYWGMGHEYRPILRDIDIEESGIKETESDQYPPRENRFTGNNEMIKPGNEIKSTTEQKDVKYSILGYINIPTVEQDGKTILAYVKDKTTPIKMYNVHTFVNSDEVLSQYIDTRNIRYLNPLSFLIASNSTTNTGKNKCFKVNDENNNITTDICNSFNNDFVFNVELSKEPEGRLMEFYLQHTKSGKYIKVIRENNYSLVDIDNATLLTFDK